MGVGAQVLQEAGLGAVADDLCSKLTRRAVTIWAKLVPEAK